MGFFAVITFLFLLVPPLLALYSLLGQAGPCLKYMLDMYMKFLHLECLSLSYFMKSWL